jgi:hypothetical protein
MELSSVSRLPRRSALPCNYSRVRCVVLSTSLLLSFFDNLALLLDIDYFWYDCKGHHHWRDPLIYYCLFTRALVRIFNRRMES